MPEPAPWSWNCNEGQHEGDSEEHRLWQQHVGANCEVPDSQEEYPEGCQEDCGSPLLGQEDQWYVERPQSPFRQYDELDRDADYDEDRRGYGCGEGEQEEEVGGYGYGGDGTGGGGYGCGDDEAEGRYYGYDSEGNLFGYGATELRGWRGSGTETAEGGAAAQYFKAGKRQRDEWGAVEVEGGDGGGAAGVGAQVNKKRAWMNGGVEQ